MTQPDLLFVHRKLCSGNEWYLRCINCGTTYIDEWDWSATWQLYFAVGTAVLVSQPDPASEPEVVFGNDPVIESLLPPARTHAIVAQNPVDFVTEDDLSQIVLPQFLGRWRPKCERIILLVKFESNSMELLPEVREYERHMQASAEADDDLALFLVDDAEPSPIPPGLLLPGIIETDSTRNPIVYSIASWQSENRAVVECYTSALIQLKEGALLKRDSDNLIGTVEQYQPAE